MSRDKILAYGHEVQTLFPSEFLQAMRLTPVDTSSLDELLARTLTIFPPVFLPIFERDAELYAVHLRPKIPWQESKWVLLPHDAAEPVLVATRLRYLPAGLLVPPHILLRDLDKIWELLQPLVNRIPGATLPEKAPFQESRVRPAALKARFDPLDGAAKIATVIHESVSKEQAQERIESIGRELRDNIYALAAVALVRARFGYAEPVSAALKVLRHEVPIGFQYPNRWIVAESGPDLLELIRPIAMRNVDERNPFAPLKDASFKELRTATVLREIAGTFHEVGDDEQALNQLRNGAAVAAIYGRGLDAEWCEALAEQAERIETGGISASLAKVAAEVIHLGP